MSAIAMPIQPLPGLSLRNLGLLAADARMNRSYKETSENKGITVSSKNQPPLPEMK